MMLLLVPCLKKWIQPANELCYHKAETTIAAVQSADTACKIHKTGSYWSHTETSGEIHRKTLTKNSGVNSYFTFGSFSMKDEQKQ